MRTKLHFITELISTLQH